MKRPNIVTWMAPHLALELAQWERRQRRERAFDAALTIAGIAAGAVAVLVALGVL